MEPESHDRFDGRLSQIEAAFGGHEALEVCALHTQALLRRRKVRTALDLLRLALHYGGSQGSLRQTAAWAGIALGIQLSDVSLLERLREMGDFLAALATQLLASATVPEAALPRWPGPPIRLTDGSLFTGPGAKGFQQRLHASYDPDRQAFDRFEVSDVHQGEDLTRLGVQAGCVYVGDRNFSKTRALRAVHEGQAFFVTRAGLRSMCMVNQANGERLNGAAVLQALGQAQTGELAITIREAKGKASTKPPALPIRLILVRASAQQAARERARVKRSRSKFGVEPTAQTQQAVEVLMVATNLPVQDWPAERVYALYRLRWQIELAFKTLKSLFQMRHVPANDPKLARTWVLANLIIALLSQKLCDTLEGAFSP